MFNSPNLGIFFFGNSLIGGNLAVKIVIKEKEFCIGIILWKFLIPTIPICTKLGTFCRSRLSYRKEVLLLIKLI